jgi:hypothetical protein
MAKHSELRTALLANLGVSGQRLHQLAQARKKVLPMTTVQAYYTIAHDEGIDLTKYLNGAETAEVRALVGQLKAAQAAWPTGGAKPATRRRAAPPKATVVSIKGVNVQSLPGLSAKHATEARIMAEKVYPMVYVFENSVRDVIERVLTAAAGPQWWATAVPGKVQKKYTDRKADEAKDPWHGRRGAREIDYVDLTDLWAIINNRWSDFAPLFPMGKPWVESLIVNDMNVSRRPLAHMNPLAADDISNMEAAFRKWAKALTAAQAEIA